MHLCASVTCFERALKKRAFGRQLRRKVDLDANELRGLLATHLADALAALLRDGRRSGDVTDGEPAVRDDELPSGGAAVALSEVRIGDPGKRERAAWLAGAFAEFTSVDAGDRHRAAKAGRAGQAHPRFERDGAA